MRDTNQLDRDLDRGSVTVRALSSITQQQIDDVAQAIATCAPSWTVQTCDDYDGYLSLLIEPAGQQERPAYYVSGTRNRIELAVASHDDLNTIARFSRTSKLVNQLATLLHG